ncbi:GNAT family N-acetyltransferase [Sphingobacterium rhinopitheci]|uniref:GNAT family N-acetyltransferase n=1 Tax=Sphingobacterium rhinopitheci TaxID=2781960 RepID=UPI001F52A65C|nr:GNAT family N-acetyltransferase [Sphingobacterium rhinopitheci]MCI0922747.1 GNAT family N-acetyltransferase [Sphingobacterium rhinopitheci]
MKIVIAELVDIFKIEPIFNLYRNFYGLDTDRDSALNFLRQRLEKNESIIFYVQKGPDILGFVQVFRTFSSASLTKVLILNDLYVIESSRQQGVASALIQKVLDYGRKEQCSRVSLSTAHDNPAQELYEKIGFRESTFKFYNYTL